MATYNLPTGFIRAASWQQPPVYSLQRSEWTGRTRVIEIGPAARWACEADVRPMTDADLRQWRAFQAAMMHPANKARVPATEGSQYGAAGNSVRNPYFENGLAEWGLPSGVALADASPEIGGRALIAAPGAARTISTNSNLRTPATAGVRIFFGTWALRTNTGVDAQLVLSFYNAGGTFISSSVVNLNPAVDVWTWMQNAADAPAGTASYAIDYSLGAWATGLLGVAGPRASIFPRAGFAASGGNALLINLTGLAPNVTNLPAGSLITAALPSGDQQLLALTAAIVANGSGEGTATLATPLREQPTPGALIEMCQPWGLMRAADPMGWNVSPGAIYQPMQARFEEAF
jgi:hypothetical protein